MKTRLVNINKGESYDAYIGRAGHGKDGYFGNHFEIGVDGTRTEVLAKYRVYFYDRIRNDPEFKRRVLALKGKCLGCFCLPQKCHGEVIIDWLENDLFGGK